MKKNYSTGEIFVIFFHPQPVCLHYTFYHVIDGGGGGGG